MYRNRDGSFTIIDHHSYSGTFVNDRRLSKAQRLSIGDRIRIGRFEFIFKPNRLEEILPGLSIDAKNLRKEIGKSRNLLQDVSIFIPAGKFVAIVGESGCGKSTLMKTLNGLDPATGGTVYVVEKDRHYDLYDCYDAFRNQFGYVPQEDIIHRELKVAEALNYAAKLRMPDDVSDAEREARIDDVLGMLDLRTKRSQKIVTLSGGERKRVSIAVELLSGPSLLFLDEASSGLDPHHEAELMDRLKQLSQKGHTVILVTHATQNITKCDLVAFMAREHANTRKGVIQSGYLVYYGSPSNALNFFGVNYFDEIYAILENPSDNWKRLYRKSSSSKTVEKHRSQKQVDRRSSAFLQLLTLIKRNINVITRDKISLILMLLVAPAVGLLSAVFWRHGIFSSEGGPYGGDAELAITNLFVAAIICCITGAVSSMREIVKERDIYQRERMVSLQIVPYVLSKTFVAIILSLYQAAVFLFIIMISGGWPVTFNIILQVYLTLFLATLAGMMQGLLISALAPNQNVAPLLLIIVLVLQLVFGGIIPERDHGPFTNTVTSGLSAITTTKWTFESMVTLSGVGSCVAKDSCWNMSSSERDILSDQYKADKCSCAGPTLFEKCSFPGIREYYSPSIDESEPPKPEKLQDPGDPPAQPSEPRRSDIKSVGAWTNAWQQYQDDMKTWSDMMDEYHSQIKAYQGNLSTYEKDVNDYTEKYKKWQEDRSRAIGKAEGLINTMKQNYGHAFEVNIIFNWGIVFAIIAAIFVALLGIQRLKDQF